MTSTIRKINSAINFPTTQHARNKKIKLTVNINFENKPSSSTNALDPHKF
jgi:hypothetical protein